MISKVIRASTKAQVPISICGDLAGDPDMTKLFLGMGLREFSMHSTQLLTVKQEILNTDLKILTPQVKRLLNLTEPEDIDRAVKKLGHRSSR